jgi:predicted DNA binding protein
MGEAKRRREYERAHADEIAADLERRRAEFARIEEIAATVPDERDEEQNSVAEFVERVLGFELTPWQRSVIGTAIEHSIEDPFTGEVSVRILLA